MHTVCRGLWEMRGDPTVRCAHGARHRVALRNSCAASLPVISLRFPWVLNISLKTHSSPSTQKGLCGPQGWSDHRASSGRMGLTAPLADRRARDPVREVGQAHGLSGPSQETLRGHVGVREGCSGGKIQRAQSGGTRLLCMSTEHVEAPRLEHRLGTHSRSGSI